MAVVPGIPGAPVPLPPNNRPNSFPRQYLIPNEKLLFETQPSLKMLRTLFAIFVAFDAVFAVLILSASAPGGASTAGLLAIGAFLVLMLLGSLAFFLPSYAGYSRTNYAVTDQRVVTKTGMWGRKILAFKHQEIVSVVVDEPYIGHGLFGLGKITFSVPSYNLGYVGWVSLDHPQEVYAYVMQVRDLIQRQQFLAGNLIQAGMVGNAVAANMGASKACWVCHQTIPNNVTYCRFCGTRQP